MSICQHCGKAEQEHELPFGEYLSSSGALVFDRRRPCSFFTPKPEPLKAKPGVRYRYIGISMVAYCDRIGMTDGKLGFTAERGFFASIPMSSAWQEVTEP